MKALLGLAMLISLWPVPAVVLIASSDSSTDGGTANRHHSAEPNSASGPAGGSAPKIQPLARESLVPMLRDGDRILADFENVELVEGQPVPGFAPRADAVATQLSQWENGLGPLATPYDRRAARALRNRLVALSDLAISPNESTLDAFNATLGPFNASLP